MTKRIQTRKEEWMNFISHFIPFILTILLLPFLILKMASEQEPIMIVGVSVYGMTLLLLFLTSAVYHILNSGKRKRLFKIFDHCSIYLLIAGTYTPFTFGILKGAWGWTIFGVIWGLALFGICRKIFFPIKGGIISTLVYLGMSWLIVIALKPLLDSMVFEGLIWLFSGGLAYTLGTVFYSLSERFQYFHFIWHLFVFAGAACHFVAVYNHSV